jgi:hypothetical protein
MTLGKFLCSLSALALFAGCGSSEDQALAADQGDGGSETAPTDMQDDLPDLGSVLDFANARDCEWSAPASTIFEQATVFGDDYVTRPGTVSIQGLDEPVTARLERPYDDAPDFVQVYLDFEARWLGLKVIGLSDAFIEEGDGVWSKGIRFDAPVAEVVAALTEAGFDVSTDGSQRDRELSSEDGERMVMASAVTRVDGETVFYCNQPYIYEGQTFSY